MNAVSYRSATVADAEELWRVRTSSIVTLCSAHYHSETIRAWTSVPLHAGFIDLLKEARFVVAHVDHQIVGYGFLDVAQARIEGIFVHPEHARSGIGKTVLRKLEFHAHHATLEQLTLNSTLNAVPFYTSQGYRPLATGTWTHPSGFDLACVHMVKDL